MTKPKLRIEPPLEELKELEDDDEKPTRIHVESTLIRSKEWELDIFPESDQIADDEQEESTLFRDREGRLGILLESNWTVNYEKESIHLFTANLILHIGKVPLSHLDIPDRHLRAIRNVGCILFGLKRFDNLILFESSDLEIVYYVTRDEETRIFSKLSDAKLWSAQRNIQYKISKITTKKKAKMKKAIENSVILRADMLRLMIQAAAGVGATERIRTLLKRGVDPAKFESIWRDAHGSNTYPAVLKPILYGKERKS